MRASSAPGIGSRPACPPTATMTRVAAEACARPGSAPCAGRRTTAGPACLDQLDAATADEVGQPLGARGRSRRPGRRLSSAAAMSTCGRIAAQAELVPRAGVAHQPGGPGQRADRTGTLVQAGAAEPLGLDERDLRAELTACSAAVVPAGPPPSTSTLIARPPVPRRTPPGLPTSGSTSTSLAIVRMHPAGRACHPRGRGVDTPPWNVADPSSPGHLAAWADRLHPC